MSVENPDVIDFMVLSDDHTQITLAAVEQRPLRDDDEQLAQIGDKLAGYRQALDSGQIPEATGCLTTFLLVVPNEPRTPAARDLLERIHRACMARGEGFTLRVQRYPDTYAELVGMTVDERRDHDPAVDEPTPYLVERSQLGEDALARFLQSDPAARAAYDALLREKEPADGSRLQRFKRMLGGS